MSVFAPTKASDSKVHNSQYIRTQNEDEKADVTPAEPAAPEKPEAA